MPPTRYLGAEHQAYAIIRRRLVIRKASAVWQGSLREGKGTMSVESGCLRDAQYSFSSRFEESAGTNPEEMIGAAHAGCFSMALSGQLTTAGTPPDRVTTAASVTIEKTDAGFTVTAIHLDVRAKVPGADAESFQGAADRALRTCPVSRLLNTSITMKARLEP
jgi:osmotically inducible protein OsmC